MYLSGLYVFESAIALDTFPYSGTTTSCEALSMGVPVLTLRDTTTHFHAQNVTSSILEYSNMSEYICETQQDFVEKCMGFLKNGDSFWKNLKSTTRGKFVSGNVCDGLDFDKKFTELLGSV